MDKGPSVYRPAPNGKSTFRATAAMACPSLQPAPAPPPPPSPHPRTRARPRPCPRRLCPRFRPRPSSRANSTASKVRWPRIGVVVHLLRCKLIRLILRPQRALVLNRHQAARPLTVVALDVARRVARLAVVLRQRRRPRWDRTQRAAVATGELARAAAVGALLSLFRLPSIRAGVHENRGSRQKRMTRV